MKIGLFFGSFNPVHVGHMLIANYMAEFTPLDKVWFVVSPQNPFKKKETLLDERQRFHILELAIGDNDKLKPSDIEFSLPKPSFTINTLTHLKEKHPKIKFSLIMGSDNLQTFHKWKNYEEIIAQHLLYIYPRPGFSGGELASHKNVVMTNAPVVEISSTMIRQAIKENKDIRYFIPSASWKYISEMNFYKG